jgi:hypothetical protein
MIHHMITFKFLVKRKKLWFYNDVLIFFFFFDRNTGPKVFSRNFLDFKLACGGILDR